MGDLGFGERRSQSAYSNSLRVQVFYLVFTFLEGKRKKIKRKRIIEKKYLTNWKLKLNMKEMIKFIGAFSSKFFNFLKYTFDFLGDHHKLLSVFGTPTIRVMHNLE